MMTLKFFSKNQLKTLLMVSICVLTTGCAVSTPPAERIKKLAGTDVSKLSGKWEGEYDSPVTKSKGAVLFDLNKQSDSAVGQITMTILSANTAQNTTSPKIPQAATKKSEKPLSIDFVGVENNKVKGKVTPYFDPRFNDTVVTTFEATLKENRLEGIFIAHIGQTGKSYNGTWWAERK